MAFGEKKSFFGRLKEGLTKTKDNMVGKIEDVIFQRPEIDEDMMEELEETLILSDIGMETTGKIIDRLRRDIKAEKLDTPEKVMKQIKKIISELIAKDAGYAFVFFDAAGASHDRRQRFRKDDFYREDRPYAETGR